MYQFIVFGLGFLLLFGGAYLIKKNNGNSGIMERAFSTSKKIRTPEGSFIIKKIVGTFLCDIKSGCVSPYSLTLTEVGDVYFNHTNASGTEQILEHGLWNIEEGGLITLTLTNSPDENYEPPRIILIQSVNREILSDFVFDNNIYTDMYEPVFTRQLE